MQSFAVIPAAGRSLRMGQPKLLLPWGSTTLLEHVLAAWRASRVTRVVVVVHPLDRVVAELAAKSEALVVQPAVAPPEMKVSVRHALARIDVEFRPRADDAWLLAPADLPGITAGAIDQLLERYEQLVQRESPIPIVAAGERGRRRHPVVFPWRLASEVDRLGDDEGIDALVARNRVELVELGGALTFDDVDTPEDYDRAQQHVAKGNSDPP
jgi:molybdenum cofactor cytidylyltransferase